MLKPDLNVYAGIVPDAGYEGGLVDQANFDELFTYYNKDVVPIDFGVAVIRQAGPLAATDSVKLPAAAADVAQFAGFTSRHMVMTANTAGVSAYAPNAAIPVLGSRIFSAANGRAFSMRSGVKPRLRPLSEKLPIFGPTPVRSRPFVYCAPHRVSVDHLAPSYRAALTISSTKFDWADRACAARLVSTRKNP